MIKGTWSVLKKIACFKMDRLSVRQLCVLQKPSIPNNINQEDFNKFLSKKHSEFREKLFSILKKDERNIIVSDDTLDDLIRIVGEMRIENLTNQEVNYFYRILCSQLSIERNPIMRIETFMKILKFISNFKITDEKILSSCEKTTLLRKDEILKSGKENVIIVYQIFTFLESKNFIFWEELEKIILAVFGELDFEEKINIYYCLCDNIKNEDLFEQYKKSILFKKLNILLDNLMIKKLNNDQYTALLSSFTTQQLNLNINNTLLINNFFQIFPNIIKTMNYRQGVNCVIDFIKTQFILAESEFMNGFVEYIIKNTNFPNYSTDIKMLLLGVYYYEKTEWAEGLIEKMMENLTIRRQIKPFLEDLSIYNKHYLDSNDKFIEFIIESSALCRRLGIKKLPEYQDMNGNESCKEGFFKLLDLKDLNISYIDDTDYNKI